MSKTIVITKDNIQSFAEELFNFNCSHEYNPLCFSIKDIKREEQAFSIVDSILEKLDQAGFDMSKIKAFSQHNWKIDDLKSPNKENPILYINSSMVERYLDSKNILTYYVNTIY